MMTRITACLPSQPRFGAWSPALDNLYKLKQQATGQSAPVDDTLDWEGRRKLAVTLDLPADELVDWLGLSARHDGFDPFWALNNDITPDAFFKDNVEVQEFSQQLAKKIQPGNVSEVFTLIRKDPYYQPLQVVVDALKNAFDAIIAEKGPLPEVHDTPIRTRHVRDYMGKP